MPQSVAPTSPVPCLHFAVVTDGQDPASRHHGEASPPSSCDADSHKLRPSTRFGGPPTRCCTTLAILAAAQLPNRCRPIEAPHLLSAPPPQPCLRMFRPSEPAVTGHRQHATVVAPPPTAQEPSARPSRTSTPDSLLDLGRRRATQQQLRPRRRALQHLRADQSSCLGQRPRMTCEATAPSAHVTLTTTSPLKKPRAQLGSAQRAAYKGPMRDSDTSPRSAASSISSMSSSRIAVPTGEHLTQAD